MHLGWVSLTALSALAASLVAIFGKVGIKNVDTTVATTVRAVFMAALLLIFTFSLGKEKMFSTINGKTASFLALSGLMGAASWLLYFSALKLGKASNVAGVEKISLVFVILISALFLAEKITVKIAFGSGLIIAGAILMSI